MLEAAIREGVALDYGCANGNCGQCRARIISGELQRIRPADYSLSAAEKASNFQLLCAHTAASDVVLEAQAAHVADDIVQQNVTARVRAIQYPHSELALLRVRTPRSQRLRFLAGQFAILRVKGLDVDFEASIGSCPCDSMNLEFHVRRVPGEAFSETVFTGLKSGDQIGVTGPKGDFILDEQFAGPLLFIAFDTGFAAIKSLLEHVTAQDNERPIILYWISCETEEPYLANLCRSWADALDQFSYRPKAIPMSFANAASEPDVARDFLNEMMDDILGELERDTDAGGPKISDFECFVSAPEPLLRIAQDRLLATGLCGDQLRLEPVRGNRQISCLRPPA